MVSSSSPSSAASPAGSLLTQVARLYHGLVELLAVFYQVLLEPALSHLHLVQTKDPTYGRSELPHTNAVETLIYKNAAVRATPRRVLLSAEALRRGGSWDRPGTSWVQYHVWEMPGNETKLNADLLLCHGINDHSGKLAPHASRFMKAGFRVIAIDLPSFGRSTGLHAYVPSMRLLVEAVHAVLSDVRASESSPGRKLFLEGHSMGGFTALYYAALHPRARNGDIQVDGIAVAAPMLAISPQSRPHFVVESIARILSLFAGRLPLAAAVRGNVSDDPRVEEEHQKDPSTYKGRLRIATGLAVLAGLIDLQRLAPSIDVPVYFAHGDRDRATSPKGTADFYERISSKDKTLKIWPGYEHVMMKHVVSKGGMSDEDKAKTAAVLEEITEWLVERARR